MLKINYRLAIRTEGRHQTQLLLFKPIDVFTILCGCEIRILIVSDAFPVSFPWESYNPPFTLIFRLPFAIFESLRTRWWFSRFARQNRCQKFLHLLSHRTHTISKPQHPHSISPFIRKILNSVPTVFYPSNPASPFSLLSSKPTKTKFVSPRAPPHSLCKCSTFFHHLLFDLKRWGRV